MKNVKFLLFFFIITTFNSCSIQKYSLSNANSIGIVSTLFGGVKQTNYPLAPASMFNKKLYTIADSILLLQDESIDEIRSALDKSIKTNTHLEVFTGDEVYTENVDHFHLPECLNIKTTYFTKMAQSSGEINPFAYKQGYVMDYFNRSSNYQATIKEIAPYVKTDLIAVSYTQFVTSNIAVMGWFGQLRLITYLYIFNKEGKLVKKAYAPSSMTRTYGNDMIKYQEKLSTVDDLMYKLSVQLQ